MQMKRAFRGSEVGKCLGRGCLAGFARDLYRWRVGGRVPSRRRSGVAVAALAMVMASCGSAAQHAVQPPSSSTPTSAAAVPSITTAQPHMLSAGQVGQRSDVPWSLVGPGWLLAKWAPTAAQPAADLTTANPPGTVLFLVDPLGGRYALATAASIPNGDPVAWSGDSKRALFLTRFGGGAEVELTVLDLATGSTPSFTLPATGQFPTFTRPDGKAIFSAASNDIPARRFALTGDIQFTFPASYDLTGAIRGGSYSPDGSELAFDTTTAGIALVRNDGLLLRFLPIPVPGVCTTLRWWNADEILAVCGSSAEPSLWLIPSDGRAPSRLGPGQNAWQLSTGVYSRTGSCHMDTCLFGLLRLGPNGTSEIVAVPDQWRFENVSSLGAFRNRLAVFIAPKSLTGSGGQSGGFVDWFDPLAGTVTPLLGGSVNGGSVNAALML